MAPYKMDKRLTYNKTLANFQIKLDWVTLSNQRASLKHELGNLFEFLAYKQLATSVYNIINEFNKQRWGSLTMVFYIIQRPVKNSGSTFGNELTVSREFRTEFPVPKLRL